MSSQQMMMTQDDGVTDSLFQKEPKATQQQQQQDEGHQHHIRVRARACRLRFHWPRGFSYLAWKYRQWKWLHRSEFVWCFRPATGGGGGGGDDHHDDPSSWHPFESKNQVILWQTYYNQPYRNQPSPYYECQVHDRAIEQGKQLVRIILHEHVAFTMDPDWSQPLVYEIAVCRVMRRSVRTLWREWVLREKQTGPMYQ